MEDIGFLDEEDPAETHTDPLDSMWYAEVPEVDEPISDAAGPEASRVSKEERATQIALAFLDAEGLLTRENLDLLTDVILERGWSAVQLQVRGLVRVGYEIPQIHLMFQLTSVWLHYMESDSLAPERWHGGARLTWLEAARLLDFIGFDAEIEQVADFLSGEQEIWEQLRRSTGQLATFKNYLFGYRLANRTQVADGIWQINLKPEDSRSFDGTRNALYCPHWWDEPDECGRNEVTRLFGTTCDPARIAEWLCLNSGDSY